MKDFSSRGGANAPRVESAPFMSVTRFAELTRLAPITVWRFEKRGWLRTVAIAGRKYITAADQAEFMRRMDAGEFAGKVQNPRLNAQKPEGRN